MQTVRVFMLMAGLTALLVVLGGFLGGQQGATVFFVIAAIMNFGMYWFSDRLVLRMYRAKVIERDDAPDLYDMVDRLRKRAGLPMPTVAVAPSEQPNAFATGRNARNAVVCCTAGILKLVDRAELEGVIAHELAHIQHRHMLVGTIAATMTGPLRWPSLSWPSWRHSPPSSSGRRSAASTSSRQTGPRRRSRAIRGRWPAP